MRNLREWGKRGGLCEITDAGAPDRDLLRDIFFARAGLATDSHKVRRQSLLLILELCRQLSARDIALDEWRFASAVYFGEVVSDEDERFVVVWPKPLVDIATRWRMYYFHYYMSVALEGIFSWLVSNTTEEGLAGISIAEAAQRLDTRTIRKDLNDLFEVDLGKNFGRSTPIELFQAFGASSVALDEDGSHALDQAVRSSAPIAENQLERRIRECVHLQFPTGLAIPLILLGVTLGRYSRWESTPYGNWLASAARDPYVDLVPPVVTYGLGRKFGQWWNRPWGDIAEYVLFRYVVQQHQSMSYEKTAAGDRCLLQMDGHRVMSNSVYEKIGISNSRFSSALQILEDLGLLIDRQDQVTSVTNDGKKLLKREIEAGRRL